MYFVLKSLNFIYIPLYMFRTPLCPSSGASQLHMQSLVPCGAWFIVSSSPEMNLKSTKVSSQVHAKYCMAVIYWVFCTWHLILVPKV